MTDRATPHTRSQAVSDRYPPTLIMGNCMRSLGAAMAGGSPLSSPIPSSGSGSSPQLESLLTAPFPHQQAALSLGATSSPPPHASTSGA